MLTISLTQKVPPCQTIGHAINAGAELEFTVYSPGLTGDCSVYEDDGATTQYTTKDAYARTTAKYTTSGTDLTFEVSAKAASAAYTLPETRLFTLKLVNSLPPTAVYQGHGGCGADRRAPCPLKFSRWPPHPRGSWHFEGDEMTVIINAEAAPTAGLSIEAQGVVPATEVAAQIDGMKGKLRHALISKANLDETRTTPGAHTPYPGGSMISQAASTAEALSYLAGNDMAEFGSVLSNFSSVYASATEEIEQMAKKQILPGAAKRRVDYSLAILATE